MLLQCSAQIVCGKKDPYELMLGHDDGRICGNIMGILMRDLDPVTKAKNYLSIDLHDEVEESDDVPFSGMKWEPLDLPLDFSPITDVHH